MHATLPRLLDTRFPALRRRRIETLQANLGYRCNQSCLHCHVNAGPTRTEQMTGETVDAVLAFLRASGAGRLDLTGGAPELNPHFRDLVRAARSQGLHVIDRCNLTILGEPGQEDLAEFLAAQRVEVVASMPCYLEENVNRQRGDGVFDASIAGLCRLNALGYGLPVGGLVLNLVYNPGGASLPPEQTALEAAYKQQLASRFGIVFNRLFALANMPIQRFGSTLVSRGEFAGYMGLLRGAHRDENLAGVMCRTLISVGWDGRVYDCDFNQMLGLPLGGHISAPRVADLLAVRFGDAPIRIGDHCWGCTAGQGSSCGGALATSAAETSAAP